MSNATPQHLQYSPKHHKGARKLSPVDRTHMLEWRRAGYSIEAIARAYGISLSYAYALLKDVPLAPSAEYQRIKDAMNEAAAAGRFREADMWLEQLTAMKK